MELPSFAKEYLEDKLSRIEKNELMRQEFKSRAISLLERMVAGFEDGFITIDELMEAIADPFRYATTAELAKEVGA